MHGSEARCRYHGVVEVVRGVTDFQLTLRASAADGGVLQRTEAARQLPFEEWVSSCNVTERRRLDLSERLEFGVGPQPVRGTRRPTLGDLLFPYLAKPRQPTTLYAFQREGIRWLLDRPRAILADDMGLGKTIQVLVALQEIVAQSIGEQALVVSPKTLLSNWIRESGHWVPGLVVRSAAEIGAASMKGGAHVVVCTYEELGAIPRLREHPWAVVVADEAHRLRTGDSARAALFRELKSARCWLLTGTPIENSASDLANLLSYLDPKRFSKETLLRMPEAVRPAAHPYLLRRRKVDVVKELPAAQRTDVPLAMSCTQSKRYLDVLLGRDGVKRNPLQKMALCRALCDLSETSDDSAKLDWLENFTRDVLPPDEKVVVFSAFLPILRAGVRRMRAYMPGNGCYITGETPANERQASVVEFQKDTGPRVLFLSMGVGAEGLTLTRANHVVFLNEWWNPSMNQQARDRVLRIGQHRPVYEYRLFMRDTVEERVRELIASKQATIDDIVEALASGVGKFDLL
jgi:SNF2 family DNA or RNA helicase